MPWLLSLTLSFYFFLLLQEKDDIYDNNIKVKDITTLDHWKTLSYEELTVLIGSQPFYN